MAFISISVNKGQLDAALKLLDPKQYRQALYVTVRNATRGAKTDVKKVIRDQTTLKAKYIDRVIKAIPPTGNPPVGKVIISQELIPLVAYRVSASKKSGVSAVVSNDRSPIILRHAFMAQVRSAEQTAQGSEGHRGVFVRSRHLPTKGPNTGRGRLTKGGIAGRFAIEEQFGPSVVDLVDTQKIGETITDSLTDRMAKELDSQIDRFTK